MYYVLHHVNRAQLITEDFRELTDHRTLSIVLYTFHDYMVQSSLKRSISFPFLYTNP